jgi:Virus neck protein
MTINHYFQSGVPGGRSSEQLLVEDIIIECMKIYGFEVSYLTRKKQNLDNILVEDPLNDYENAYDIEVYLQNVDGFAGDPQLLSKFGVELRDQATFIVSRRRWDEIVGRSGTAILSTRPAEGDLIYFPLTKSYFEIKNVNATNPFYQVGKLYVYELTCELFQYSSERINTGDNVIDTLQADHSLDITNFELLMETGDKLNLEYETLSSIILESYDITIADVGAQNDKFEAEISVLDFTEKNPFGEAYNQ